LRYFAEEKGIEYEEMSKIFSDKTREKENKYNSDIRGFKLEHKKIQKAIIDISNQRSKELVKDRIGSGKNLLIYLGRGHADVIYNLFGKDRWREFEISAQNQLAKPSLKATDVQEKHYDSLSRASSIKNGMIIKLVYHEHLYPSFQSQEPITVINASISSLEILQVEKVGDEEIWVKVRVLTSSEYRYYGLEPAQKGETGWIKITTEYTFDFEIEKSGNNPLLNSLPQIDRSQDKRMQDSISNWMHNVAILSHCI
jgi:hypothetical protein